uniref:Putative extensin-like n=1 Tax=Davidia involucrata TaxID=16924 RepID=A0A5B6ZWP6_DAVIN
MRFLEGISSRLSQLELYCYNLDKSIGEMRSDLVRDHGEADSKLKSLEKHVQEVHRSVQILRDKQELAETQKELAKLQLAQKESSTTTHSQQNEERSAPPASDPKKTDNTSDVHSQQLALALPHQPSLPMASLPPTPPQNVTQSQAYYLPPMQIPNPPAQTQPSQGQYLSSDSQYRTPQMQDISRVAPQPTQSQVNQSPQIHPFPQFQQQWPQQVQPMQPQIRPSSAAVYPPYLPSQPANPSSSETLPNSMPMQVPFSQPGANRAEAMPYGYVGAGRTVQSQPTPQQLKAPFGVQPNDGYTAAGPHPTLSAGNAYMMYEGEAGRTHHPSQPHFPQGGYPPTSVPFQNPQPNASANLLAVRPPQFMRNHPYNELIEKLVNMGYRGDHVVSVIQRLEESGQPVDFNAVLDRLNVHSSGGSQRGWSG